MKLLRTFFVSFMVIFLQNLYCERDIRLNELSSVGGRFVVIENSIYTFDSRDFAIKVFSKGGKLKYSKKIKGEGPGELSTNGFIVEDGKNLLILEPMRKKWVRYDSELNFLNEGWFDEPINFIKRTDSGIIGALANFSNKYYRKLFLFSNNFEKIKEIFKEYGENFSGKIVSNELYITFDEKDGLIAFASGNSNRIKLIDYDGNLKKEIEVMVRPCKYKEEELSSIFKNLPAEARELIDFKIYPYFLQILFLQRNELLVITGEFENKKAKSYIYEVENGFVKRSFYTHGGFYQLKGDALYSLMEDEYGCIIKESSLSEIIK